MSHFKPGNTDSAIRIAGRWRTGRLHPVSVLTLLAICTVAFVTADGGELRFRRHVINEKSEFLAAAAFDVNDDGRIDIVCGAFWYEAPDWRRHPVRNVEMINGRPDGYAHLPWDVNNDGRTDVVTVNYRSRSIKWIEQPGEPLGPWKTHLFAEPGPMETGRLHDVDGDGQLDILPNGAQFAAWWSLAYKPVAGRPADPIWQRHELPQELAGHGLGCGDINGDGRVDVVGQFGWAEAPEDRRTQRWRFHADFELDRASVPILVVDVDDDGDRDLVWCQGHDYGTYWIEQLDTERGRVRWNRHAIDSSWGGGHAPLWVDLDGDGRNELVVGKRYLPHEGRDPGEYDPLVGYRYQFDPATRTWWRGTLSAGEGVGFGLDPKAADLDADGDLDLLCAGRNGLFWLENQGNAATADRGIDADAVVSPDYRGHQNLMVVRNESGAEHAVRTPFDWGRRRAHVLAAVEKAAGSLPNTHQRVPLEIKWTGDENGDVFVKRSVTFAVTPGQRVAATLLIPTDLERRAPAVICSNLDDAETTHDIAERLARRGIVCFVLDGDALQATANFESGAMAAVWCNIRAIDLLETLEQVDARRIACFGDGPGGVDAIITAAFDGRVRAVAASRGVVSFVGASPAEIAAWSDLLRMPRIGTAYADDPARIPFDFPELVAAVAPRPILLVAPTGDERVPPERVSQIVQNARRVYALHDAEESLRAVYPDCGRDIPAAVQAEAIDWLIDTLRRRGPVGR